MAKTNRAHLKKGARRSPKIPDDKVIEALRSIDEGYSIATVAEVYEISASPLTHMHRGWKLAKAKKKGV